MFTAILATILIQALLAALLFGTARLDRAEPLAWMARHPLVRQRTSGDSAQALAQRRAGLDRLGAATRRAAGETLT